MARNSLQGPPGWGEGGLDPPKRVRVAVVSDALLPWHKGGKETRYQELLRRLPEHGLDVTVYTMKWWTDDPPAGPVRYKAICPRMALYTGERRSFLQALVFSFSTLRLLLCRFDVIEADQMPVLQLYPLRLVAWIRRVDLVVGWHEVWGPRYWREYLGTLGIGASLLEKYIARRVDRLLPGTSAVAQKLIDIGVKAERITVIPHAVDRNHLESIEADSMAPEILFVSRLLFHKRCDLAIRTLAELRAMGFDVRLGVVGVGPELERLKGLSSECAVADQVEFYGGLEEHDDVWRLMKGARVLLYPSEREGFGLTVAEALALGTPVVCVDHTDNQAQYLVDDGRTGSVVTTGDLRGLFRTCAYWVRTREDRETISGRFWASHSNLDWNVTAETYALELTARFRSAVQ